MDFKDYYGMPRGKNVCLSIERSPSLYFYRLIKDYLKTSRPGLLEAWLALTSVKYHGNLYVLIPLNQRLALTSL